MKKRSCNLTKYIQTEAGPRYCPAIMTSNGRIKQDVVSVGGKEEKHPEGAYYLDWRENSVRIRLSVGKNAVDAQTQWQRKAYELNAVSYGLSVNTPQDAHGTNGNSNRKLLAAVVHEYLDDIKATKKRSTHDVYRLSLNYFLESCPKKHLDEIERKDLLRFSAFLRDEKVQSPRSVHNRFTQLVGFLKTQGIRGIVNKNDWPRFTQEEPEVYEQAELDTLFAVCTPQERLWFEFFLMTGMREQEVMYTYWADVNLIEATVRVSQKPLYGWSPKAYREREIPIPTALVTKLRAAKAVRDKACPLVFHTGNCRPKHDYLLNLKNAAKRAGLDPENFWLHKFRATFCTWALWAGVDLRTAMSWMGHADIESTMRYLKPSRSQTTRDKVNVMFAGGAQ